MHPDESCRSQGAHALPALQVCQAHDLASFCRQSHTDAAWRQEETHAVLHLIGGCPPLGQPWCLWHTLARAAPMPAVAHCLQGMCSSSTCTLACTAASPGPSASTSRLHHKADRKDRARFACGSPQPQRPQRSSAGSSSVAPPHFVGWRPHSTWLDSRSCANRKALKLDFEHRGVHLTAGRQQRSLELTINIGELGMCFGECVP